jgi:hypothetical protein
VASALPKLIYGGRTNGFGGRPNSPTPVYSPFTRTLGYAQQQSSRPAPWTQGALFCVLLLAGMVAFLGVAK